MTIPYQILPKEKSTMVYQIKYNYQGKRGDKCCLNLMIWLLEFENYLKWFTMDYETEHA